MRLWLLAAAAALAVLTLMVIAYSIGSAIGLLLSAPPSSSYGAHQLGPVLITVDTCSGLGMHGIGVTRPQPDWLELKLDCPY